MSQLNHLSNIRLPLIFQNCIGLSIDSDCYIHIQKPFPKIWINYETSRRPARTKNETQVNYKCELRLCYLVCSSFVPIVLFWVPRCRYDRFAEYIPFHIFDCWLWRSCRTVRRGLIDPVRFKILSHSHCLCSGFTFFIVWINDYILHYNPIYLTQNYV